MIERNGEMTTQNRELPKKLLGRTGLEVGIVGLGTAFLGIPRPSDAKVFYEDLLSTIDIDEELGIQTVIAALEAGCTLIDTAPLYGRKRSERIIAQAFSQRPDLVSGCVATTKVGYYPEGFDYSYDMTIRCVEESQERLARDRFEVVYVHDPMNVDMDAIMSEKGTLGALKNLQRQGIVKHIGIAADDPDTNAIYIETGEFDAAVVPGALSLLNQRIYDRILPAAVKFNVGLVIATPLERGVLATGFSPHVQYLERNFSENAREQTRKIHALCEQFHISPLAVALQWCTRHDQVATTIPGAATPEQARANIHAGKAVIPEDFWGELEKIITLLDYKKDLGIYSI